MPLATEPTHSLIRQLIYGEPKTKKTWWALRAAEAGFNVILADGDDGHHIIAQLDPATRKRIGILKLVDDFDDSNFYNFITRLSRGKDFAINETTRKAVIASSKGQWKDTDPHVLVRPRKLNQNDVLIIDSWTALCSSMSAYYNRVNNIVDIEATKQEWDDYSWAKRFTTKLFTKLHALPCHVVVIAHAHIYEKYEGQGRNRKLVSQTMQPLSYSGPQGAILAKEFTDIFYTYVDNLKKTKISTRKLNNRAGGSRIFASDEYNWEDITFSKLIEKSNGVYSPANTQSDSYNSEGIQFFAAGDYPHELYGGNKPLIQSQGSSNSAGATATPEPLNAPTGDAAKINLAQLGK